MAATPADIAEFTTDGVLLRAPSDAVSDAIKAAHVDARDGASDEIEQFYDDPDDGQALLDELQALQSAVNPLNLALEVNQSLGLGSEIPVTPAVPSVTIVDNTAGLSVIARIRSYAMDLGSDRFSIEVLE